jgi:hypothetical protein
MKRDMDLLRSVLFFIEENYKAGSGTSLSVHIDGYDDYVVYEHVQLAYQSGLIGKTLDTSNLTSFSCFVGNITNAGYDYLDKIRDDTVWNKTKEVIKKKGLPMVVDTIKTVATALITATAEGVANAVLKNGGII